MPATLQIQLFGGMRVALDNKPIGNFYSIKAPALLAYLAVTRRTPTRDTLASLLWGEMSDVAAKTNLRQALANLHKLLEPYLLITRDTAEFNFDAPYILDVEQFETYLRGSNFIAAVALYQGDFLDGVFVRDAPDFEEWALAQRARLRELALQAMSALVTQCAARGENARGIEYATRLIALDPWREEAHRELMLMLARTGQRSVALAQYETCKRVLQEQMGVEPSAETTALFERIRAAGASPRHNLPAQPTTFVGRARELAQIESALLKPERRLVTLLGSGGIGKTRLALQAAEDAVKLGAFLNGVYFVPLASVDSPDLLVPAMADACEFAFSGKQDPPLQLVSFLRDKEILFVLDNFEQLLGAAAWLAQVLKSAPQVKLLVTSRERLNLQWEWLIAIEGLDYPDFRFSISDFRLGTSEQSEIENRKWSAVELFVERARQACPDFELNDATRASVARVCQLVEGMPLGIELAAAWAKTHDCDEIAREIERGYDFLATTQRDASERQRSLRAVFERSWQLLDPAARQVFSRLSVFRGGFTREAAERVAGASLARLSALVDKSLLRRNASSRYEMHELLRQYAAEKLRQIPDEQMEARRRHGRYYADHLQHRQKRLKEQDPKKALSEIRPEIENLRAAWHWAVEPGKPPALAEIEAYMEVLLTYWEMQASFLEGERAFAEALAPFGNPASALERLDRRSNIVLANLLARRGWFCFRLARYEQGRDLIQTGLSILRRLDAWEEMGYPLLFAGACAFGMGRLAESKQLFLESHAVYERAGDAWGIAGALNNLGQVAVAMGEHEEANRFIQASLAASRAANIRYLHGHALSTLARLQLARGEFASAQQTLQECLSIAEELEDQYLVAEALGNLGAAATALGELAEAEQRYQQTLRIAVEIGDRWGWANTLNRLGDAAVRLNRLEESRQHFRRALETAWEIGAVSVALNSVQGMAWVLAGEGNKERALELATFALYHADNEQVTRDTAQRLLIELRTGLPAEQAGVAEERGKTKQLADVIAELLKL